MDYLSCTTEEELLQMIEHIEKHMLENDYENAFFYFLLYIGRLEPIDRDSFIIHFKKLIRKITLSNIRRPG
jgi:hypothetical protein